MIDSTTAISVINNMGTCHSDSCNSIACKIWTLCEENGIWLTAAHIPGKENVTADYECRNINSDTEWMLNPKYLSQVIEGIRWFMTAAGIDTSVYKSHTTRAATRHSLSGNTLILTILLVLLGFIIGILFQI